MGARPRAAARRDRVEFPRVFASGAVAVSERAADRWLSQPPQYLTGLQRCRPTEALTPIPTLRHWRMLPYTTDTLEGVMLLAGPETAAPTITFPMQADGWHALSIGVVPAHAGPDGLRGTEVQLRLTGEPVPTLLTVPDRHTVDASDEPLPTSTQDIVELFWKIVDLSGQELEISQVSARLKSGDEAASFACGPLQLAYVKLVPLTDDEVAAHQLDSSRADTRRLFAHQDSHGPHWIWRLTDENEIRRELEPYRGTDFARMYWETGGGDELFYFTKLARLATCDEVGDFTRRGDRLHAESWRVFRDKGIDPFEVALSYTHEIGLEFHAGWRVSGFHYPPPLDQADAGDTVYDAHPAWRGEDRAGRRTPILAYTYPEVREYVISLLREMAGYPVDGIALLYNRRLPLVEYEPPLVNAFKREHGGDPRELDERDPQWLSFRCGVLTQFMREVRAAMTEISRAQGRSKPIAVSAVVEGTEAANRYFGLDLETWAREGLVDTLIPYLSDWESRGEVAPWADASELDYFKRAVEGTACLLAPNVMPRHMSPANLRRRAATIYGAGVDHLFFWDCAGGCGRANYRPMWSALRRLGHKDEVDAWQRAGQPDLDWVSAELRKLGDWDLSYADAG